MRDEKRKKWEYKIELISDIHEDYSDESLDELLDVLESWKESDRYGVWVWQKTLALNLEEYGKEGWEVVSIQESLLRHDTSDGFVLFKRLKQED